MRWTIFCWKRALTQSQGLPLFQGANFQQMVIVSVIVWGLRISSKISNYVMKRNLAPGDLVKKAWDLCNQDWPGCSIMNMMHLKVIVFLGGALSFYSVSCMYKVIFNPSLLNWSSLTLTVAHIWQLPVFLKTLLRLTCKQPTIIGYAPIGGASAGYIYQAHMPSQTSPDIFWNVQRVSQRNFFQHIPSILY